jgi:hypothetical protein
MPEFSRGPVLIGVNILHPGEKEEEEVLCS